MQVPWEGPAWQGAECTPAPADGHRPLPVRQHCTTGNRTAPALTGKQSHAHCNYGVAACAPGQLLTRLRGIIFLRRMLAAPGPPIAGGRGVLLVLMAAAAAAAAPVADAVRPPPASGKADTSSPPSAAATAAASPSDRLPDAGAAVRGACSETVAWAAKGLTSSSAAGEGMGLCVGGSASGPLLLRCQLPQGPCSAADPSMCTDPGSGCSRVVIRPSA